MSTTTKMTKNTYKKANTALQKTSYDANDTIESLTWTRVLKMNKRNKRQCHLVQYRFKNRENSPEVRRVPETLAVAIGTWTDNKSRWSRVAWALPLYPEFLRKVGYDANYFPVKFRCMRSQKPRILTGNTWPLVQTKFNIVRCDELQYSNHLTCWFVSDADEWS